MRNRIMFAVCIVLGSFLWAACSADPGIDSASEGPTRETEEALGHNGEGCVSIFGEPPWCFDGLVCYNNGGTHVCGYCDESDDCPANTICKGTSMQGGETNAVNQGTCQTVSCTTDAQCIALDPTGNHSIVDSITNPSDEKMKCCSGHCVATISDTKNCGACGSNVCSDYSCVTHTVGGVPDGYGRCNTCAGTTHSDSGPPYYWSAIRCTTGHCIPSSSYIDGYVNFGYDYSRIDYYCP